METIKIITPRYNKGSGKKTTKLASKKKNKKGGNRSKAGSFKGKTVSFRSVTVPMARATRTVNQGARHTSNGRDGIVINHTELFDSMITDNSGSTGDVIWYWTIQPAFQELFPYLSRHSLLYEFYKIRSMTFHFRTQSNAGTDGIVVMGYDLDPHDQTPSSDLAGRQMLMSMEGSVSGSVWQDLSLNIQSRHIKDRFMSYPKGLYVKGEGEESSDSRLSDFGVVYIGTFGTGATAKTLGDLYVTYEVELRVAQVHYAIPVSGGTQRPGEQQLKAVTTVNEPGVGGIKVTEIPNPVGTSAPTVFSTYGPNLMEVVTAGAAKVFQSNFTGLRPIELEIDFAGDFADHPPPANTYVVLETYDTSTGHWEPNVEQPTEPSTLASFGRWISTQVANFGASKYFQKYIYRAVVALAIGRLYRFVMTNPNDHGWAAGVALTLLKEFSKVSPTYGTASPVFGPDGLRVIDLPMVCSSSSAKVPTPSEFVSSAQQCAVKEVQGRGNTIPGCLGLKR